MNAATIIGQVVLGWIAADFLAGFAHWLLDRVLTPKTPIVGKVVVTASRLHHTHPLVFADKGIIERNMATLVVTFIVAGIWFALLGPSLTLAVAIIGSSLSSVAHYYTHLPRKAPRFLRVMQETGLIQSPRHHAQHHRNPQSTHYCPLTNLLNPILDFIGLWSKLERLLGAIGRKSPISLGNSGPKNTTVDGQTK